MNYEPEFMRTPRAAAFLGVSVSFLNHLRVTGGGPPYSKISSRIVVYEREHLQAWARNQQRVSTSSSAGSQTKTIAAHSSNGD